MSAQIPHQQQSHLINSLPQQSQIPQIQQPPSHQQTPQTQQPQPPIPSMASRVDIHHPMQQQQATHHPVINHHVKEQSQPPQPPTQARGTPQPPPATQSSSGIGVGVAPQQLQAFQSIFQHMPQNWMLGNAAAPNPAALIGGGHPLMPNGFPGYDNIKLLQALQAGHAQQQSGVNNPAGSVQFKNQNY